jgi:A/G-specific adenine glycosylase
MSKALSITFSEKLLAWQLVYGRTGLPWQGLKDPYPVWVSEIMLQQTQVATILERFPRFMQRFPTVQSLAEAPIDAVLAEWAGMGYYSRARNLHTCAKQVVEQFGGQFPHEPKLLETLKGIGRSTAGAIAAFAFQERAPILDANVKRVLARLFGIEGSIQEKKVNDQLWSMAQEILPVRSEDMPAYTQALMDFGASWCSSRKPVCLSATYKCPFTRECQAYLNDQVLALPQKTIKTKSPEFLSHTLLFKSGDQVLLQKRPDQAIWGGLWSLPESTWQANLADPAIKLKPSIQELLQLALPEEDPDTTLQSFQAVQCGKKIKHIFTHRRLWIQIWQIDLDKPVNFSSTNLRWVALRQLDQYGLPQPIKLVLQALSLTRDDELKSSTVN